MSLEVYGTRTEWLAARGIGASATPIILGLAPFGTWGSPYSLWAEMTGLAPRNDENGDKPWLEWGLRLEQPIADAFAEKTVREVQLRPPFSLERHPVHPWLTASPDADQRVNIDEVAAYSEVGDLPALPLDPVCYEMSGLLQIKTASAFNAKEWRAGIPLHYQVQLQHEMYVSQKEWSTLCVLIDNSRFKVFPDVRRDDQFISAMLPKLAAFQELVETQTEPPIDDSEATARALDRMHRGGNNNTIALPDEAAAWDARLCSVKDEIKRLESEQGLIKNKLKQVMKVNTFGLLPNGDRYSWKQQTKTTTCKACQFQTESAPFDVLRKVK